jgi:cysteine-rich repeat protein
MRRRVYRAICLLFATVAVRPAEGTPRACPGVCGDGVVDACEQCDLGAANCPPGTLCDAGCTSDCRVIGRCTGGGALCTTAADCAPGEGCCGNGVREPGEQCDDGNLLDGDCCASDCQVEPADRCEPEVCRALGPHLRPIAEASVEIAGHVPAGSPGRWRTSGQIALGPAGGAFAGQAIELRVTQQGADICRGEAAPGAFVSRGPRCPRRWRLRRAARTLSGILRQPRAQLRGGRTCAARLGYVLRGTFGSLVPVAGPGLVRESLRLGEDCYTALLACQVDGDGTLACRPAPRAPAP